MAEFLLPWLLSWLVFAAVPAVIANSRGRNGPAWFALSLLISPLLGIILVLALPSQTAQRAQEGGELRKCPHCAELVKWEAKICRFCQRDLPSSYQYQAVRLGAGRYEAEIWVPGDDPSSPGRRLGPEVATMAEAEQRARDWIEREKAKAAKGGA